MVAILTQAFLAQAIIGTFPGGMAFQDYGVPTKADSKFKTHYVYSEADDVTKQQMLISLKLD